MKPINAPWVKRFLHRPPMVCYDDEVLEIHIKQLPKLERMPLDTIKGVKSTEGRLTIQVNGKGVVGEGAKLLKRKLSKKRQEQHR